MFSESAIAQTLEDEFLELEPAQVRQALQQAGGSLVGARMLCARLAAQQRLQEATAGDGWSLPAQPQQQQQQHQQQVPAFQQQQEQQRQWWPRSDFCPASTNRMNSSSSVGGGSSGGSSSQRGSQRPALVPHQVLPAPSQPTQQQHQVGMQSAAAGGARASAAASQAGPSGSAVRRLLGVGTAAAAGSDGSGAAPAGRMSAGLPASAGSPLFRPLQAAAAPSPAAAAAASRAEEPPPPAPLHPHYAAVFLSEKSQQQLLQHVAPLHEEVSADHMTMCYKPSPADCYQLPLGREAALFVVGAAADYRAQALAVQPPSWVPVVTPSTPHVTVSVGEGVPAKEAGDLTARALEAGQVAPVIRLKLLQGIVGVQLSDGSRVFSEEDLRAALAEAAARQQQQQQARAAGGSGAGSSGPAVVRILARGERPLAAAAAPAAPAAPAVPAPEPATEPAVPPPLPLHPPSAPLAAAGASSAVKAAAWDLDALLDQLHLADLEPASGPGSSTAGSSGGGGGGPSSRVPTAPAPPAQARQAAPAPPQRRGLLKLPTQVAAEMAAPSSSGGSSGGGGREAAAGYAVAGPAPTIRVVARPPPAGRRPAAPQQQQGRQQQGASRPGGVEPAPAPPVPVHVVGKSVAEEAAEAAAGEEPLDLVSSLASLLPPGQAFGGSTGNWPGMQQQQQQGFPTSKATGAAAGAGARAGAQLQELPPPLPSMPGMLPGGAAPAPAGGGASSSGYETSSSGGGPEEGIGAEAAAAPVDPESHSLLQIQFPDLHSLVIDTALRMHGGSLQTAAQFLAVLDHQQQELGLPRGGASGAEPGRQPAQPTLGSYLEGLLPEAAAPAYDFPGAAGTAGSSSSASSFADSSYDFPPGGRAAGGSGKQPARRGSAGPVPGRSWQQQQQQAGGSGGRGRGKTARRSSGGGANAGDDPMSVTERQAMNLHLSAKRLYTQAAQEAFSCGQVGLGKELQATARSHADAATAARRRANASAFRSTNASVMNTFTLDLHGQHVDEALTSLERYLVTLGGLGHPGGVLLQVITGVGRHSHGNQPRVLPAVVRYLSEAGYKFDSQEDNPGVIVVSIGC